MIPPTGSGAVKRWRTGEAGKNFPPPMMKMKKASGINWRAMTTENPGILSVHVSATAYPTVFSDLVGVMSMNGFDILEAKSYRNADHTTVILKTGSVNGQPDAAPRLRQAKKTLDSVFQGKVNLPLAFHKGNAGHRKNSFSPQLQTPPEITVDNEASFLFTLIHVSGKDFTGVLYTISDAIVKCGLTIWNTKINTVNGRIADIFYVKDENGNKIDTPEQIAAIRAKVRNAYKLLRYV